MERDSLVESSKELSKGLVFCNPDDSNVRDLRISIYPLLSEGQKLDVRRVQKARTKGKEIRLTEK